MQAGGGALVCTLTCTVIVPKLPYCMYGYDLSLCYNACNISLTHFKLGHFPEKKIGAHQSISMHIQVTITAYGQSLFPIKNSQCQDKVPQKML